MDMDWTAVWLLVLGGGIAGLELFEGVFFFEQLVCLYLIYLFFFLFFGARGVPARFCLLCFYFAVSCYSRRIYLAS